MRNRVSLAQAGLDLGLSYHQVRTRLLRGDLRGGLDERGHFYIERADLERVLRARARRRRSHGTEESTSGQRADHAED